MAGKLIVISEYGSIEEHGDGFFADGGQELSRKSFENLWAFSHSDSRTFPDIDKVFKKTIRSGKRRIQACNYVGTVQTTDGTIIEILPKIYRHSGQEETDKSICRLIFLKMLSALRSIDAVTFQDASLQTRKNFPILEVYISNYLNEAEQLYQTGLGKNYILTEGNKRYLKGSLMFSEHIRRNSIDQSRFYVRHHIYDEQIPQNKIIVSTLQRLQSITSSTRNSARINMLLDLLSDIPASSDIHSDLHKSLNADRMMDKYTKIIRWSETILLGRGFTTFSGNCINQALLFPAEKLFESFVAKLFKDYFRTRADEFKVHTQHTAHYLVDRQGSGRRFQLRPDIFIEAGVRTDPFRTYQSIIIDTKWKNLNQEKPDSNYLIEIKDMYQLFAYGQKYEKGPEPDKPLTFPVIPKLVLLYPFSQKFNKPLDDYIFDKTAGKYNLRLQVEPFDLTSDHNGYMEQISHILSRAYREILLIGCYRSSSHLEWIRQHHLYNVRLQDGPNRRPGAISPTDQTLHASKLLLYDINHTDQFTWYDITGAPKIMDRNALHSISYPFDPQSSTSTPQDKYLVYTIKEASAPEPSVTPAELVQRAVGYDLIDGTKLPSGSFNFIQGAPIYIDSYTDLLD
jgi:5-methylcytosine-specific restriction enzyme subunit McrC